MQAMCGVYTCPLVERPGDTKILAEAIVIPNAVRSRASLRRGRTIAIISSMIDSATTGLCGLSRFRSLVTLAPFRKLEVLVDGKR